MDKIKVLFVCLGNICRSPAAEGAFKDLINKKSLESVFYIDSAGTSDYHIGSNPHFDTVATAKQRGIILNHKARQFSRADFNFDFIIAMDESNYDNIISLAKEEEKNKVFLFRHLPNNQHLHSSKSVPDPYYYGNFDKVQDIVEECSESLLEYIQSLDHFFKFFQK